MLPAASNALNPVFKRLDIRSELCRFGKRFVFRSRLVMTWKPFRAFRHSSIECVAVSRADINKFAHLLCLDAIPVPLNDSAQEHFFYTALPRFAKQTIYERCLLLVFPMAFFPICCACLLKKIV